MLSLVMATAFGVCAGRFVREYQELKHAQARLAEVKAQMDMTKPGSYLEWISK